MLVFPASFAEEKADKQPCGLLQFSKITRVTLDELAFIVQLFNYLFCQRFLIVCRSYVASFAESFQVIAECFVCFCKKRVSDNGMLGGGLFSSGRLRCRSRAARIAVRDFLLSNVPCRLLAPS